MSDTFQTLTLLPEAFMVFRLVPSAEVPDWVRQGSFYSITRTADELSIVCAQSDVPGSIAGERNWRCFQVAGPIPFTTIGVLSSLVQPLAQAAISLFAISTFDTDYILVREADLNQTISVWKQSGHRVDGMGKDRGG